MPWHLVTRGLFVAAVAWAAALTPPFHPSLAANIGVVTIAQSIPVPGGGTAVGTVGLSAVLVSFGVPRDIAVAAVLANQLAFYYLPAIPGWFATRHLIAHDYL